ncbi:lysylphosphatidylglycerol synthase transmembrane domain-containing protein [Pollutibacter soli]|uniref:lysylphosphatidylglycerol synthase transmembrane domain-containing protein n=1 Tax=Pollutibacter soli TaxID=3034157 RepID=UPI0030139632
MKKIILTTLQYIFFLGLGLFLLWWTTKDLSPFEVDQLKNALKEANYLLIIPAMIFLLLSHYSRSLRWKILMEPLNFQPSTTNTFFAVMLGYFFNLLVPRLGEVMKCTILARYEKTPVDKLIGTMVAERAIDVICLIIVIFITIFIQIDIVGDFALTEFKKAYTTRSGSFDTKKVLVILGGMVLIIGTAIWALRKYRHIGFIGKIITGIKGIWQGLTSIRFVKRKAAFAFHTLFIWAMYLLSIRIGFYAMEPVSHLGIGPSFTILTFGSLAMIITQGGIGAYQLAVQKTLTLYNIGEVDGLAYGWLLWAFQTILVLVIGLFCLFILPFYNRKRNEKLSLGKG